AGQLLVASRPDFERAQAAIPPTDVIGAARVPTAWRGQVAGAEMEAALAPFSFGVVAVLADPSYIDDTLASLARPLLAAAAALVLASLVVGYMLAAGSLRPLTRLARTAYLIGSVPLGHISLHAS